MVAFKIVLKIRLAHSEAAEGLSYLTLRLCLSFFLCSLCCVVSFLLFLICWYFLFAVWNDYSHPSYLTHHPLLLHVDSSCCSFCDFCLHPCLFLSPPQHWRLHPHRVFLLLWVPGPGEARRASELALHVLDDRRHLRLCHGLGHHPTLWWGKQAAHSLRKSASGTK